MRQRLLSLSMMCLAIVVLNTRNGFAQAADLLPNLTPKTASEISIVLDPANGHTLLRFAAINQNLGAGPLDVHAGGVDGTGQQVFQRIYRTDGTWHDELAGTMTYHPQHNHFHVNNFEVYTLKPAGEGTVTGKTSEKTSFCLEDTTPIDLRLPGAPQNAVYTTCNPDVQGISVGWGDRYGPTLPGQSIDITGDAEGDYDLIIEADPDNHFIESNESDNLSCVRLHINPSARTFQAVGTCGAVAIDSITPNTMKPGSSIEVTINGDGFTPGLAVGFENGTGPAPVVSNVVWVDATTMRATVTVKNGGGKQTRYWDLRVGPALRYRAFTIKP